MSDSDFGPEPQSMLSGATIIFGQDDDMSGPNVSSDLSPSTRFKRGDVLLGRYRVDSELGEGAMGLVYKCRDIMGRIDVAVKMLPPEISRNDAVIKGIRENYSIVARLHHSAISGLRQLEQDPYSREYFLVMDLAKGHDLYTILRLRRGKPMTLAEAQSILRPLASALDYAHSEGVLHRDVKPANVMVDYDEDSAVAKRVQLLDFGLAAEVRSSMSHISLRGHAGSSGTPAYMAPEQWKAKGQSASTDQYALAVMAYQMLSGALPFDADDRDLLREAVIKYAPDPVRGLPRRVNAALLRALAKDPRKRFPSCQEFVDALEKATPLPTPKTNLQKRRHSWQDVEDTIKSPLERVRSNPRMRIATALSLLLVAGVGIAISGSGSHNDDSDTHHGDLVAPTNAVSSDSGLDSIATQREIDECRAFVTDIIDKTKEYSSLRAESFSSRRKLIAEALQSLDALDPNNPVTGDEVKTIRKKAEEARDWILENAARLAVVKQEIEDCRTFVIGATDAIKEYSSWTEEPFSSRRKVIVEAKSSLDALDPNDSSARDEIKKIRKKVEVARGWMLDNAAARRESSAARDAYEKACEAFFKETEIVPVISESDMAGASLLAETAGAAFERGEYEASTKMINTAKEAIGELAKIATNRLSRLSAIRKESSSEEKRLSGIDDWSDAEWKKHQTTFRNLKAATVNAPVSKEGLDAAEKALPSLKTEVDWILQADSKRKALREEEKARQGRLEVIAKAKQDGVEALKRVTKQYRSFGDKAYIDRVAEADKAAAKLSAIGDNNDSRVDEAKSLVAVISEAVEWMESNSKDRASFKADVEKFKALCRASEELEVSDLSADIRSKVEAALSIAGEAAPLADEGKYSDARTTLGSAYKRLEGCIRSAKSLRANAAATMAQKLFAERKWVEALDAASRALSFDPDNSKAKDVATGAEKMLHHKH